MDTEPISIIEDLSPEPRHKPRTAQARELALGLVLLLGVLGWAGWQTWQQSSNENHYQAAEQAVARHDWDAAYANFSAARGYKDSQDRATQTARLAADRDKAYQALLAHTDAKEWVAALNSAQDLKQIEPGYKRTAAVEATAKAELYRQALSGTVALRTEAAPPGLYYRTGDRWLYLLGSDPWSKVLAFCPGGQAVYDTPGRDWSPPPQERPTPTPSDREPGSPQLKGRLLTLFSLQADKASFSPIALDPSGYYTYSCSEHAIWGMMRKTRYTAIDMIVPHGTGFDFVYAAFGSQSTARVDLPLQGVVADIDRTGEHMLLAGLGVPQGNRSTTSLYLTGPDGGRSRLLYTTTGDFQSAQFSPSGRYALLITRTASSWDNETNSALLFDLASHDPPQELAHAARSASSYLSFLPFPLSGTFLQYGPMRDRLLLAQVVPEGILVQTFDPADGTKLLATVLRSPDPYGTGVFEYPDGTGALLALESGVNLFRNGSITSTLTLAHMDLDGISPPSEVLLGDSTFVLSVAASKDKVLFGVTRFSGDDNKDTRYNLMSASLTAGSTQLAATQVYTASWPQVHFYQPGTIPTLGDGVLSYINGGNLHVRSYNDLADTVLEQGIGAIYDIRDFNFSRWLR